jgi:hypothetical protein
VRRAATDLERTLALRTELPIISVRTLLPLARHIRSMLITSIEEFFHVNASHAVRPLQPPTTPRRSRLRPWPVLPVVVRTQLSQQFAQILRQVRDGEASTFIRCCSAYRVYRPVIN